MIPICMSTPRWEPCSRTSMSRALFHPWSRSATRAIRGSSSLRAAGFTTPAGTPCLPREGGATSPAAGRGPTHPAGRQQVLAQPAGDLDRLAARADPELAEDLLDVRPHRLV